MSPASQAARANIANIANIIAQRIALSEKGYQSLKITAFDAAKLLKIVLKVNAR
jgi:hypothetical protein